MNEHVKKARPSWRPYVAVLLLGLAGAVAVGEWLGWPFLAGPLQNLLSDKLARRISFEPQAGAAVSELPKFQVRFIGGIRANAAQLLIASPEWSTAPHMLQAQDVKLELRYIDLWRAYQGQRVRIQSLQASTLDSNLERLDDGRASWQFGAHRTPAPQPEQPLQLPLFGQLLVTKGVVHYRDAPLAANVDANLSLAPGASIVDGDGHLTAPVQAASVLRVDANGRYRNLPLKILLDSSAVLPSQLGDTSSLPVALVLNASVGQAHLDFKGKAVDALQLDNISGHFSLKGPSLAAVGDPIGVTLPTTAAFRTDGNIVKQWNNWKVVVDDATVGASRLNGAFTYEGVQGGRSVPLLSGRLGGSRLLLVDLGPVVGTTPATMSDASATLASKAHDRGKVLPDRPFDLAALRKMDANVLIDIGLVDLNTSLLEPLQPLHTHLQVVGGVLTLRDLLARTAQGQLRGELLLDGREKIALMSTDLRWDAVRLERWIHQSRGKGLPPYIAGQLYGQAKLTGRGRSTAEILASLSGTARTELRDGAISHLGVELAGLDLAQGLGMLVKGDDALPVQCAVADLVADGGVFRPKAMVVDTNDSAVWVDGSLSLATEAMDLRAVVVPKDFSPLTLRTPVHVRGTFEKPEVSLEKGPLATKIAASLLLALVNPFAAIIPLVDMGNADAARRGTAGCQALSQRSAAALAKRKP
ncbi:AsmA family protein [Rhodoferax sp.]|uniref:AsmA family protein n=1 Tax=Rhodoferax sp. TaxID=50421 RepID=UPI00374DD850